MQVRKPTDAKETNRIYRYVAPWMDRLESNECDHVEEEFVMNMCAENCTGSHALWTARLDVFEQDFDTAMTIWRIDDGVVERLCTSDGRSTRRRGMLSQMTSQAEWSQATQASTQTKRGRKRRRATGGNDSSQRAEPPLISSSALVGNERIHDFEHTQLSPQVLQRTTQRMGQEDDDAMRQTQRLDSQNLPTPCLISKPSRSLPKACETIEQEYETQKRTPNTASEHKKQNKYATTKHTILLQQSSNHSIPKSPANTLTRSQSIYQHFDNKPMRDTHFEASSGMEQGADRAASNLAEGDASGSAVLSGFSTGSGRRVSVSKERLQQYEDQLMRDTHFEASSGMEQGADRAASNLAEGDASGSAVLSGFSTGSGRRVSVSKERLQQYEDQLMRDTHFEASSGMEQGADRAASNLAEGDASGAAVLSGFSTGSGRRVSVSKERLQQYEDQLMRDTHFEASSGMEQGADRAASNLAEGDASGSAVLSGFSTGSGRRVSVSKERLQQYEDQLMRDTHFEASSGMEQGADRAASNLAEGDASGSAVLSGFSTGSGRRVSVSKERLQQYEDQLMRDTHFEASSGMEQGADRAASNLAEGDASGAAVLSGFSTGSGRRVSVSKERLQQYEDQLMRDTHFEASSGMEQGADRAASNLAEGDASGAAVLSGFSTGSGRRVSVSKERLQQYEDQLMRDTHFEASSGMEQGADRAASNLAEGDASGAAVLSGFSTGSGRRVSVSKERLQQYEDQLMRDTHFEASSGMEQGADRAASNLAEGDASGAAVLSGFSTGSGRRVSVSKERLQQYEDQLMRDTHFEASSGMEQGADRAASNLAEGDASGSAVLSGFSTGSGRRVSVSKERLQQYEDQLMRDTHFEASSGMEQGADRAASNLAEGDASGSAVLSGFSTGSGRRVSVSKERLQQYEDQLMRDTHFEASSGMEQGADRAASNLAEGDASGAAVLSGFSTGSGRRVSVSKERLQQYEDQLMRDTHFEASSGMEQGADRAASNLAEGDASGSAVLSGFSTGSGRRVSVSKERLQQYEDQLMRDTHFEASSGMEQGADRAASNLAEGDASGAAVLSGFSTGSGRRVSVSKERLQQYEDQLMRDTHFEASSGMEQGADRAASNLAEGDASGAAVLSGFSTGSGRRVSVSKERLQQCEDQLVIVDEVVGENIRDNGVHEVVDTGCVRKYVGLAPSSRGGGGDDSVEGLGSVAAPREVPRRRSLPPAITPLPDWSSSGDRDKSNPMKRMVKSAQKMPSSISSSSPSSAWSGGSDMGSKRHLPKSTQGASAGYTTPAKSRSSLNQTLSAKKGFRPPVPLKTPPTKSIITPPKRHTPKAADILPEMRPIDVHMRYHEMMRVSYKLLVSASRYDSYSIPSDCRGNALNKIDPINAVHVSFDESDESEFTFVDEKTAQIQLKILEDMMKARGYFGNESMVSSEWFRNHFRWIIWKLATMELRFPRFLYGRYLTRSQVMFQMCKRYQRDIVRAQRSIIKKVLNRDANAGSCMVLRIAAVLPYPAESDDDLDFVPPPHWKLAVVLTDGWYGVYAVPDSNLAAAFWTFHEAGRLIGLKIATWGSSLQNVSDGIDPLECQITVDTKWRNPLISGVEDQAKSPYLKLPFNSTRSVQVDVPLGLETLVRPTLHRNSARSDADLDFTLLKSVPLRSIEVGGGLIRSVRVRLNRVSPILHLQPKDFTIGPRILCEEQMPTYLQARQSYLYEKKANIANEEGKPPDMYPSPVPFTKLEVTCSHVSSKPCKGYGVLTIWRPGEDLLSRLKEGEEYYVTTVSVSWKVDYGNLGSFLRLGTTKGSTFDHIERAHENAGNGRHCDTVDLLARHFEKHVSAMPKEKKVLGDVCLVVLCVEEGNQTTVNTESGGETTTSYTHVFATDSSLKLMSLRVPSTTVKRASATNSGKHSSKGFSHTFGRGSKRLWSEGSVVCISGLEVSHFDDRLGVLDCELVEGTRLISMPTRSSHFFEPYNSLRHLIESNGKAQTDENKLFSAQLNALRKRIQREILHLDVAQTQDCNENFGPSLSQIEAEHLTQDLGAQPNSDVMEWMSQAPIVVVEGHVVGIVPLVAGDDCRDFHGATSIVYVRSSTTDDEDGVIYPIYLSDEHLTLIRQICPCEHDTNCYGVCSDRTVSHALIRFEAQWETSERLLNSWKSWVQDDGASFLLGSSVSISSAISK